MTAAVPEPEPDPEPEPVPRPPEFWDAARSRQVSHQVADLVLRLLEDVRDRAAQLLGAG